MSILKKCIRYSWEVSPDSWQGATDSNVAFAVQERCSISKDYKTPVEDKSPEFYQVSIPMILALKNSNHQTVLKRNFWNNKVEANSLYYPSWGGQFLTQEQRDTVLIGSEITHEHKFVLFLTESDDQEIQFESRLAMTFAYTTYTCPTVLSLNDLTKTLLEDKLDKASVIKSITESPMLILTDVFGTCDRVKYASGGIASLLKERMFKGRTTVFTDSGKLHYPRSVRESVDSYINKLGPINRENIELFVRSSDRHSVSINDTQLHRFFWGGMTYVMDIKSFAPKFHKCIH